MKKIKILSLAILGAIIVSCATSNNVVSGKLISKRKVNKGFHINSSRNLKGDGDEAKNVKRPQFIQNLEAEEITAMNTVAEEKTNSVEVNVGSDIASVSDEMNFTENKTTTSSVQKSLKSTPSPSTVSTAKTQKETKISKQDKKAQKKAAKKQKRVASENMILIYILCVLLPFVAVGLVTDWETKPVVYNILWCLLCGIPGIIHAFIVVGRES